MHKIFISYKRQDKDKVFHIVEEIKQKTGIDCWIDLEGIESGDLFQNVIIDAIDKADIVVFMLSKNFIASYKDEKTGKVDLEKQTFPEKEVMYALRHNKRLVPISIDGTTLLDCKWLDFNCSGLDYINWNYKFQQKKLFQNLKQWAGQNIEVIPKTKTAPTVSIKEKIIYFLKNPGCTITITIALILFVVVLPLGYFSFGDGDSNQSRNGVSHTLTSEGIHNKRRYPPDEVRGKVAQKTQSIDLGLSSGTLWADMNIGAKFVGDYGDLYSWGEIETKGDYRQSCYTDINTMNIIGKEYDIATNVLGNDWQLPSQAQFDELIKECSWEWNDYGFTVVGKNGNSIFLPASGWICSSIIEHKNRYGYYWTGDKINSKFAKGLIFSKSEYKTGNGYLYYGRAVRAVRKKNSK